MRIIAIREKTFAIASPIRNAFQPFGGFPDDIRVEAGYVRMHDTAGMVSSGNPSCTGCWSPWAALDVGFSLGLA